MTDRLLLVTIPHTGTRFFGNLLRPHFPYVGMRGLLNGKVGLGIIHVSESALEAMAEAPRTYLLVTTWRQPDAVWNSWRRRGKDIDEYLLCRTRWHRMVSLYAPFVLTLEEGREESLAELGEKLGIEFKTDWQPVTD